MTARVLRPAISFVTVSAVILAALAVYFSMGADTTRADSTYNPIFESKLCNALPAFVDPTLAGNPACADVTTTGTAVNTTTFLTINQGDLNFSSVVTFSPNGATIAAGGAIATGTKMGGLFSEVGLGLLNGACTTPGTQVEFVFYNVALPNNANPSIATNIAYPQADGTANRFERWRVGSVATGADPPIVHATFPGKADPSNLPIQNYPSYLLDVFDPTPGAAPGTWSDSVVPLAVYGGLTNVAGSWIPLFFAQFSAGQLTALPGATTKMVSAMGQPNVSVLNDPTATATSPSAISDFCSKVAVTTMLLGDPAGAGVRYTNPAVAGTYFPVQYDASLRDLDQDGYENALDTCPKNPNSPNNTTNTLGPRGASGTPGDADGDGLWSSCDPNDTAGAGNNADEDNDGFQNRQDNCPLSTNGGLNQNEAGEVATLSAPDLGPKTDSIGDACDSGGLPATGATCTAVVPGISGGQAPDTGAPGPDYVCQNGRPLSLTQASGVANGRYHVSANIDPVCIGGTDADGDGYCAGANDGFDAASGPCPHPACTTARHQAWGGTHPGQQMDTDGDRVTDSQEWYLGTDSTKSCAQTSTANDETPLDNWPLDLTDNGLANSLDLTGFASSLGKYVGEVPAATKRIDFNNDGFISSLDLSGYAAALGKSCGAFANPISPPIPAWSQQ